MSGRRMLVVGAHSADFVWRAAGAIACHTAAGGEAVVVALSYGERGESGELWKQPDQTEDNVKRIRHTEAEKAATAVGARFEAFDLGDYPLRVGPESVDRLTELMRDFAPHVVLTHPEHDPFNPDHPAAHAAMAAQRYLQEYYKQRADQRGNHARKVTGDAAIRQAEAFQRLLPNVVEAL